MRVKNIWLEKIRRHWRKKSSMIFLLSLCLAAGNTDAAPLASGSRVVAGASQPLIKILPPTKFSVNGPLLHFPVVITNAGNKAFAFTGGISDLYECALQDSYNRIVHECVTTSPFRFRDPAKPSLKPRESVTADSGVPGVSNGTYVLILRMMPGRGRWPMAYFDEAGTAVVLSIYGTNVSLHKPPRPVMHHPRPTADILARYIAQPAVLPPTPTAPMFVPVKKKIIRQGRIP